MRSLTLVFSLGLILGSLPAEAQGGIVVEGDKVLTGGSSCPTGKSLVGFAADGSAVCICLSGLTQCPDVCVDLDRDSAHCGSCGNACSPGASCVDGRCRECDPVQQDCAGLPESCVFGLSSEATLCVESLVENPPGEQGDACSFDNGCARGYGCVLPDDPDTPDGRVCALFCDPDMTFPYAPDQFCETHAGTGLRCVRVSDFYADVEGDDVAFCAGPEWFP